MVCGYKGLNLRFCWYSNILHVRAIHRARVYDNSVVTFPAVAIFQFNPSTYTVAEDVAGGQQAVSLQLISGILSTNIGLQVTVTGGTATAIGTYVSVVCRNSKWSTHSSRVPTLLFLESSVVIIKVLVCKRCPFLNH